MRIISHLTTGDLDDEGLDNRDTIRGLINQGEPLVEQEQYRDDLEGTQRVIAGPNNTNGSRPRVEPSGLAANNSSEQRSDDV